MARLSLEIVESNAQIEKKIRESVVKEANKVLDRAVGKVIVPVRSLVKESLQKQPEVISLNGGQLAAEFGLSDGGRRIENIIDYWVNNIIVSKKKATASGKSLNANFTIKMIPNDYLEVLGLNDATVITAKGQQLPWLDWLLRFGDRAIVRNYDVLLKSSRRSRSGVAIMVQRRRNWGVPSQFAGTIENNFVTRALDGIEDEIMSIIETQVRSAI